MITSMATNPTPSVFDVNALTSLKAQVKSNDPQALRAAAQQFEGLFVQMVMKSMRDATPREGLFDSDSTRMYESLLDQQLAQVMASKSGAGANGGGLGLAAMIERQLAPKPDVVPFEKGLPLNPEPKAMPLSAPKSLRMDTTQPRHLSMPPIAPTMPTTPSAQGGATPAAIKPVGPGAANTPNDTVNDFIAKVAVDALTTEQRTGIPAQYIVAQAALESGWGKSEPRFADGRQSFNLFGIKAGKNWTGAVVEASTTEYVDGQPQRKVEPFRAYASYAEAFTDYASLLTENSRYAGVVKSKTGAEFARGLQNAGYATDPEYAVKLEKIINTPALRALAS